MMRLKDGSVKVWPVILIHPHAEWYDFNAKYSAGGVDHLVPAPLPEDITRTLKDISVKAFEVLGCAGVARTDCMIDKDGVLCAGDEYCPGHDAYQPGTGCSKGRRHGLWRLM